MTPVEIFKAALADAKSAVVHTPGTIESLIVKAEAALQHLEQEAALAVGMAEVAGSEAAQAVEKSLDDAADAKDAAQDVKDASKEEPPPAK